MRISRLRGLEVNRPLRASATGAVRIESILTIMRAAPKLTPKFASKRNHLG